MVSTLVRDLIYSNVHLQGEEPVKMFEDLLTSHSIYPTPDTASAVAGQVAMLSTDLGPCLLLKFLKRGSLC